MVKIIETVFPRKDFFGLEPEERLYYIKVFKLKRYIDALPKKNVRAKAKQAERARLLQKIATLVENEIKPEDRHEFVDYVREHEENMIGGA